MPKKFKLIIIFIIAIFFRFYNLNWDQNHHLHPDERFLTMVATVIKIPQSFSDYLNPKLSPLSPYNNGYGFFVYGTFPLNLTKIIGVITKNDGYDRIHLVGRFLSAFFDLGIVFLLFKIGQKVFNERAGLLAAFLYSMMVLPIQLSHYFAVDTFLNFFIVLSFYFLINIIINTKYLILNTILLALSFGLALSCKISSLFFLPVILLGIFFGLLKDKIQFKKNCIAFLLKGVIFSFLFALFAYLSLRIANPYYFSQKSFFNFSLNQQFLDSIKSLKSYDNPNGSFPPSIQWIKTKPILYPLQKLLYWGLGLPLGIISVVSVFWLIVFSVNHLITQRKKLLKLQFDNPIIGNFLILFWTLFLFIYQGYQFSKCMRYLLPIYPFMALTSAKLLLNLSSIIKNKFPKYFYLLSSIFYLLILIYPVSFMSIYRNPLTRIKASEWIYKNIPPGATLSNEHWDDALPVPLPDGNPLVYKGETSPLYDADLPEKWQRINEQLKKIDYIILSSSRLYGSIMTVPKRYPQTTKFYKDLFEQKLGFKKVAEFTSRPTLPLPFLKVCLTPMLENYGYIAQKNQECSSAGISFVDDYTDESFTVYDHPKVIIFQKF